MCPENARVFIAEDDSQWRKLLKRAVIGANHEVTIEVDDIQKGIEAIPKAAELNITVALVDGRIPNNPEDGSKLTIALHESIRDIKVIDVSAFGDSIKNADAKMAKMDFNSKKLGQLITEL